MTSPATMPRTITPPETGPQLGPVHRITALHIRLGIDLLALRVVPVIHVVMRRRGKDYIAFAESSAARGAGLEHTSGHYPINLRRDGRFIIDAIFGALPGPHKSPIALHCSGFNGQDIRAELRHRTGREVYLLTLNPDPHTTKWLTIAAEESASYRISSQRTGAGPGSQRAARYAQHLKKHLETLNIAYRLMTHVPRTPTLSVYADASVDSMQFGVGVVDSSGDSVAIASGDTTILNRTGSSGAETVAAILAITTLAPLTEHLTIYTDSRAVRDLLSGGECSERLSFLRTLLAMAVRRARAHGTAVSIHWVKGHSGVPGNEQAHEAANNARRARSLGSSLDAALTYSRAESDSMDAMSLEESPSPGHMIPR